MERETKHIEEYLDKSTFPWPNVELKTKFGEGTLLVYCELECQFTEYKIHIEKYFEISKTRKVKFTDFK